MSVPITRGATTSPFLIRHIFVQSSSATDGSGLTAKVFSDFTVYYIRDGEAVSGVITPQDITTIGTYAAPTANTNVRIKKVDDAKMPGIYEVHLHQDWVNTTNSCQTLTIFLSVTGGAALPLQIPLIAGSYASYAFLG